MLIHELKCWPEFYDAMASGAKTFDIRKDDRPYAVGDLLAMRWWDPEREAYAKVDGCNSFGRPEILLFQVTYCLRHKPPWVLAHYVAMGLRRVHLSVGEE